MICVICSDCCIYLVDDSCIMMWLVFWIRNGVVSIDSSIDVRIVCSSVELMRCWLRIRFSSMKLNLLVCVRLMFVCIVMFGVVLNSCVSLVIIVVLNRICLMKKLSMISGCF